MAPAERMVEEKQKMRPLPATMPDVDRRQVFRVAAQPLVWVDRNDYSIDSRFAGRRVQLRVSRRTSPGWCWAPASWPAGISACFAAGCTIVDPAHQTELERARERRRHRRDEVEVEVRPLSRKPANPWCRPPSTSTLP